MERPWLHSSCFKTEFSKMIGLLLCMGRILILDVLVSLIIYQIVRTIYFIALRLILRQKKSIGCLNASMLKNILTGQLLLVIKCWTASFISSTTWESTLRRSPTSVSSAVPRSPSKEILTSTIWFTQEWKLSHAHIVQSSLSRSTTLTSISNQFRRSIKSKSLRNRTLSMVLGS